MTSKILLVANTDWYLYNFRLALACFLREQGFEVVLVSPPGRYAPSFEERGFRWVPWEIGRQTLAPWREIPAISEIAQIFRREKPDLIHQHTIKPVLYGSLVAKSLGLRPVVNSIPGRGYVFLGKGAKASLLKRGAKILYRLAFSPAGTVAIFENSPDREYFISEGFVPASRTWLIPGVGVDPQRFLPSEEPEGTPVVLFSGRMLWDKGVGVLVEAARLLHQRRPVRVALAGDTDPGNPSSIDKTTLQGWEQEGVVEWWGWQPDMIAAYARSHIVTLPTMYGEGVPTVLLEAASCGRAIVATDMPGCRDIVIHEQTGLIVPPNDPAALAGALEKLISDPSLRGRMGAAARRLVLQKFTTAQVNAATLAVYHQALGQAR